MCRLLLRHQHSRAACRVIRIRKEIKAGHSGGGGACTHILMAFVLHATRTADHLLRDKGCKGAGLRLGGGGSAQGRKGKAEEEEERFSICLRLGRSERGRKHLGFCRGT